MTQLSRLLKHVLLLSTVLICELGLASGGVSKRLLVIDSQSGEPYSTVRNSMLDELKRRGYDEASGFVHEYYSLSHYQGAAINLWKHRVQKVKYDAIFLNGTLAVSSFKQIAWGLDEYPFIFATVTDPVGLELVSDYDKAPPANFTGVAYHVSVDKRIDFVKTLIPKVKNIGLVYADMPQSHSYKQWIEELAKQPSMEGITFHFRTVDFIPSEGGHRRMAQMAKAFIKELDPIVDVFISPNDQMGAQKPFVDVVTSSATKPLVGLGYEDVAENWGAVASIHVDAKKVGIQAADMIERLFKGEKIKDIHPQRPKDVGIAINEEAASNFGISIPSELRSTAEVFNPAKNP